MNFKKIAIIAAITATSSVAMAGEGFYAGVGISATGSDFNRTEDALTTRTGQTNSVGVVDVGYATQINKDWGIGFGATLDTNKTNAGSVADNDQNVKYQANNHHSIYLQPYLNLNANTSIFTKVGYHSIKAKTTDLHGTESHNFNGFGYGFGMKTMATKNIYLQAEVMWVDYKAVSDATDTNKLKTTSGLVSVGYQF